MMNRRLAVFVLVATIVACSGSALAELIAIDPVGGVTASSTLLGFGYGFDAGNLVDGSGLSAGGHSTAYADMWLAYPGDNSGWVVFDLGAVYSVTNIHVWNFNGVTPVRGVKDLVVKYGTNLTFGFDLSFESTLSEISTLTAASGVTGDPGEAFDTFSPFNARYILFDIVNTHGGGEAGLSEVQFFGTFVEAGPTPPPEITGVTVESYSTQYSGRPASATLGNDGLNILGYHTTSVDDMWLSNGEALPEIVYDLGTIYDVQLIEVWNYNEANLVNRGINGVNILGSQDGSTFSPVTSTTFAQAPSPASATTDFSQTIPITVTARYIKLDVTSNHGGGSYTGLSEIKFYGELGADAIDPDFLEVFPADGAIGVGVNANMEIVFDEAITNVSGNITIRKSSDNSVVEAFNVASSDRLTWNYPGWSVTIDPTSDLDTKTGYYVEIDATAITDLSGNSFAGISGSGTWSFMTSGRLITNTTVDAFFSEYPLRLAVDAINGTGLPGSAPALYGAHGTAPGDMWLTNVDSPPASLGYIIVDLGANYVLDTIHVWNYNEVIANSMKDVQISVSSTSDTNDLVKLTTNGTGDTDNGSGDFLFPKASGTSDYLGFNVDLRGLTDASLLESVRLVKIENTSNYNGGGTGLAEIHFGGEPWKAPPAGTVIYIR